MLAAKVKQQREILERQIAGLQIYASNKAAAAVRTVMRVPRTGKRAKAKPKYQNKKNKSMKWSAARNVPIWMREETKGTKLTKEEFFNRIANKFAIFGALSRGSPAYGSQPGQE